MNTVVSAVFNTHEQAEKAVAILRMRGIPDTAISVISRHPEAPVGTAGAPTPDFEERGMAKGVVEGAAVGTLLGFAALALPGVGPFVAAGAILGGSMAAGAAVGGALGTIGGALKEQGYEEHEARFYERRLHEGAVFLAVDAGGDAHRADVVRSVLMAEGGQAAPRAG